MSMQPDSVFTVVIRKQGPKLCLSYIDAISVMLMEFSSVAFNSSGSVQSLTP